MTTRRAKTKPKSVSNEPPPPPNPYKIISYIIFVRVRDGVNGGEGDGDEFKGVVAAVREG